MGQFEASWEKYSHIEELFPEFHLEDKVQVWKGDIDENQYEFAYSRRKKSQGKVGSSYKNPTMAVTTFRPTIDYAPIATIVLSLTLTLKSILPQSTLLPVFNLDCRSSICLPKQQFAINNLAVYQFPDESTSKLLMAAIIAFSNQEKTIHNSHKFSFSLKPTRYGYWRSMIEAFLTSHNLFGYVDGTVPCPKQKVTNESATTENPSYIPWISNDAHIRMLIISTMFEDSYQHIQGKTSREVWLSLKRAYAPVTASHEFTLKNQLLRITMKGDEKTADYLSRVNEYATALANIGEPMKDKDLVMLTIAGLREEYNVIKGNLLTRLPPVRFNELHGLLSDHDYVFTKTLTPQAFLTNTTSTPQPPTTVVSSVQQPTLDQIQQQLQSIQLVASQLGYQLNPLPTQRAHAYYGYRSFNNNRGGRDLVVLLVMWHRSSTVSVPKSAELVSSYTSGQFCITLKVGSSSGATWKPDTGATHHATPDLSSIDNSEAYYGNDSLLVGNDNSVPIFHIGSSKIYSPNKTFNLTDILHVPQLKQNLLSVQKFCLDNNVFFEFHSSYFVVKDESTQTTLLTGPSEQGLYSIRLPQLNSLPKIAFTTVRASSNIWHQRLGHPHAQGGEFRPLTNLCRHLGIIQRRSCPHTSEQNGLVERRHRHFVETGLTLLAQSSLPQHFWYLAFETTMYLINRLPSRISSNKSPFEQVFNESLIILSYESLVVNVFLTFVLITKLNFGPLLAFSLVTALFTMPPPPSTTPYISIFPDPPPVFSTEPPQSPIPTPPPPGFPTDPPQSPIPTTPSPPPHEPHQSSPPEHTHTPPLVPRPRPSNLHPDPKQPNHYNPAAYSATAPSPLPLEPTSFTVANKYSEWRQAMADELAALHRNGTWTLVPPVPNANIVDSKWVYRLKTDEHCKITRYKARFVAKGFHQQHGVDYHETFSPVIKPVTIRTVLSLAVTNKWPLRQLDIQTAFLHGDLEETSLYGLKQAPRAWFIKLSTALRQLGFVGSKTDPSLFILNSPGSLIYLLVYIDDIIITGNNSTTCHHRFGFVDRHNTGYELQAFYDSHWSPNLQAYSDSDWAGCPIDHRSTGGYAIYLGSNMISWSARKQKTVSRSSTESEYKAIADTVAELIWLKSLLRELGLNSKAPTLWCDNLGATYLTANHVFHARTKHVEVDYNFVREQVTQGNLNVKFISTDDQIADIFTKPLPSQKFEFLRFKL
ncbi:hypothetical protein OSB04_002871 [Centaurea solstitialis]|uniref:Integrase catalytic domain-containing protein n=1 Tax=Centaurea solstitialis TaxID=347529 RepID=A0AA38U5H2_9ASTR|nr:hypothetical protein OSB04_002871 [Centaurea solstitialis]